MLVVDLVWIEKSKELISLFLLLGIERGKKLNAKKTDSEPFAKEINLFPSCRTWIRVLSNVMVCYYNWHKRNIWILLNTKSRIGIHAHSILQKRDHITMFG